MLVIRWQSGRHRDRGGGPPGNLTVTFAIRVMIFIKFHLAHGPDHDSLSAARDAAGARRSVTHIYFNLKFPCGTPLTQAASGRRLS